MKLLQKHIDELYKLCRQHHVSELYAFGSVVKDNLSPGSDVDLLVKFGRIDLMDYFDNYMELKEKLEKLFSRKIDLVEVQTLKNPILRRSIDRNKMLIYGRENTEMVI